VKAYSWYKKLIKPAWAPPSWLFGPVWTFLYVLIALSFGKVFMAVFQGQLPSVVALPFVLNLLFNFIFTPIQFGLKNNLLAAADILLVLTTLVWSMVSIFSYISWIYYLQIPYLIWVSFATVLQLTVTYLNF
jgi:tryptophan-rich sensory protein